MKKVILYILIIILVILTACQNSKTDTEIQETTTPTINVTEEEPLDVSIFYPRDSIIQIDPEFISEWQKYIYDKYDIRIKLEYTKNDWAGKDSTSDSGLDDNDLWKKSKNGGLVFIRDFYTFGNLVKSGLIVPVNEYIKNIPEFAVLEDKMLEQFTWDDSIWAFPFYHDYSLNVRAYNGDWLEKYEKGIPKTLDEFTEYAEYVRDNDPDGNGIADTYAQVYRYNGLFSEFMDVFNAYGCYPLSTRFPISFNPDNKKLEVCVFSEGYVKAMTFIKFLVDEGYAKASSTQGSNISKQEYKCASSYNYDYGELGECTSMEAGYYLLGENEKNLVRVLYYPYSFAVLDGTEDPESMIRKLLVPLSEKPDNYIDFYCGIEGKSYLVTDDYFVYSYQRPTIDIRTGINIRDVSRKPMINEEDMNRAESSILYTEITREFRDGVKDLIDTDLVYTTNSYTFSDELRLLNSRISELTEELNRDILTGQKMIMEAITEYRSRLEEYGIIDDVEELNYKLGFN